MNKDKRPISSKQVVQTVKMTEAPTHGHKGCDQSLT